MQYFKDRTESFDHYYLCLVKKSNNIVIIHTYTIGSDYSFTYIIQQLERHFYTKWEMK